MDFFFQLIEAQIKDYNFWMCLFLQAIKLSSPPATLFTSNQQWTRTMLLCTCTRILNFHYSIKYEHLLTVLVWNSLRENDIERLCIGLYTIGPDLYPLIELNIPFFKKATEAQRSWTVTSTSALAWAQQEAQSLCSDHCTVWPSGAVCQLAHLHPSAALLFTRWSNLGSVTQSLLWNIKIAVLSMVWGLSGPKQRRCWICSQHMTPVETW